MQETSRESDALILNIKQVLDEGIAGDLAELGVFRGNSAAVLAHYARKSGKNASLFDTFEGFDSRDLVGVDESRRVTFADTSLDEVRNLVGDEAVRFVLGRFPDVHPVRYAGVALLHRPPRLRSVPTGKSRARFFLSAPVARGVADCA